MNTLALTAPYSGLRVIDASRVLAGPFCASLLADLGAEVIRVEHPSQDDEVRSWSPIVDGMAAAFIAMNHTKRSLALDLALEEGKEVFGRLLETADVLIENYRPGTLDRFGFDREALQRINQKLVHCSIRAFPSGTANELLPGYEASIQAYSGIMSITGEECGEAVRCGPSVVDIGTGLAATIAVLSALRHRDVTGSGSFVEPALLRTAVNFLGFQHAALSLGGVRPKRQGSGHASLVPYGTFETRSGAILLAASNDRLWSRLWSILGPEGSMDLPYPTLSERVANRAAVNMLVEERTAFWERQGLLDVLIEAGVPAAPVQTLDEYVSDPSQEEAGVLERLDLSETRSIRLPGRLFGGDVPFNKRHVAPRSGEHTSDILVSLGFTDEDLQRLSAAGAVG